MCGSEILGQESSEIRLIRFPWICNYNCNCEPPGMGAGTKPKSLTRVSVLTSEQPLQIHMI